MKQKIRGLLAKAINNLQKEGRLPSQKIGDILLYRNFNKYNKNSDTKKGGRGKLVSPVAERLKPQGFKEHISRAERANMFVEHPDNLANGDYSSNVAMKIGKMTNQNPIDIAQLIVCELKLTVPKTLMDKIETREGFINFYLSKEYLLKELKRIIKEKNSYGKTKIGQRKTVLIDYSSPNIAKPFGIGHLRSTIIGQALYNIYSFQGWKCIGDNHLGDWGTQFGKLIYQIRSKGLNVRALTIEDLEKLYIEFHQQAKDNPKIENEAREWFLKLENGERQAREIWEVCKEISLREFNRIYDLLNIKIDYSLGESFYKDKMQSIIKEAQKKGVAQKSEGALVVKFPNNELPSLVLVKSDGATTYFLRDLATIKYRLKNWHADLIVYEVGVDQALYFRQLFKTIELLGWLKKNEKFVHVVHGLMRSQTGKFSTRKGETVHLEDVLKEAIERAKDIIKKSQTQRGLSEEKTQELAKAVGIGAIKYNDLCQHHAKDIIFDWNKLLNLKGNSGPYLQYTYARCQSVMRKSAISLALLAKKKIECDAIAEELLILRLFYRFQGIVKQAADSFSPNIICNFVFTVAKEYNSFYNSHSILKAKTKDQQVFRLMLTFAAGQLIKNSLLILGIECPEKM